jgi:hypothetical protein
MEILPVTGGGFHLFISALLPPSGFNECLKQRAGDIRKNLSKSSREKGGEIKRVFP